MSGFGGSHGFKLDIGCVERDEDRGEFLSACSRLDEKTVFKMVDLKGRYLDDVRIMFRPIHATY